MAFGLERNVFHRRNSRRCSDAGQSPGIETPSMKEDRVPARRKSMRKTKEVLRLRFELGLGQRQIARSCGMGLGTVHDYLGRAAMAGIGWPLPEGLSEEELEAKLFGNQPVQAKAVRPRSQPDWKTIHEQLQQHRHLTLQLLWEEYRQAHPEGYRYSWFCERYQHWRRHLDVVLRQEHKAGEKMFVDWAGPTIPIYDSTTGQAWPASLFVSVLGASSYTYVEATRDQQLVAWIQAHIHALEFYGGTPTLTVPDSRKSVRLLCWRSSSRIWAELHEKAFRRLGGSTRVVVLDNLKEGVLVPDIY